MEWTMISYISFFVQMKCKTRTQKKQKIRKLDQVVSVVLTHPSKKVCEASELSRTYVAAIDILKLRDLIKQMIYDFEVLVSSEII